MSLIFEFKSHHDYLRFRLKSGASERGTKTRLAEHLRVQPAFISQVLARKYSLNLEQANLANQFFDHSTEESDFLLLLVSRDRAGSSSLKKYFDEKIRVALSKRLLLIERLGRKQEVSEDAKGIYYSSWIYPAIHVICMIPGLNTRRAISEKLNLPPSVVGKVLEFLERNQLLKKDSDLYSVTHSWVRLDKDSPHVVKLHSNCRQLSIQNLELQEETDLHYSGFFAMDLKTAQKVKDRILDVLKEEMKSIEQAKEEDLFVCGLDLFRVKR